MELKVKGEKDNAKQNRTTSSEKVLVSPIEHQWSWCEVARFGGEALHVM